MYSDVNSYEVTYFRTRWSRENTYLHFEHSQIGKNSAFEQNHIKHSFNPSCQDGLKKKNNTIYFIYSVQRATLTGHETLEEKYQKPNF